MVYGNEKTGAIKAGKVFFRLFLILLIACFCLGCDDTDDGADEALVLSGGSGCDLECYAKFEDMGWAMTCQNEVGIKSQDCTTVKDPATGLWVNTCNGTIRYDASGQTYTFTLVEDWPNHTITVTVNGIGTCTKTATN